MTPLTTPTSSSITSPTAKPPPQPPPNVSPTLLFAVLEAKGTANAWTYNTVAIAGLDGYARAKTTFTPMPTPKTACMGAVLQPSAHVAAGKVFYADGNGVIRSLAIDGTVARVTAVPMTSRQQMLSFAVSPDGTKLLATVYTVPTNAWPCDGSSSTYTFDTYSAESGGPSKLIDHQTWTKPQDALALTGWDAVGPIGTFPTVYASQGGGPGSTLGVRVRVDSSTAKPGAPLADPNACVVWDSVQSGAFVCTLQAKRTSSDPYGPLAQPVSIRRADGSEDWHFTVTSANGAWSPYLAPDGQHVVICCNFDTSSNWLIDRQGHQGLLKAGFYAAGWLDATTTVGFSGQTASSPGFMSYVALNSPGTFVSMGFTGLFVGTVRS